MNPSYPIGLFDSGVGGLTVLQELVRLMPQENVVYFGDTARLPYGNKSSETIIRYATENARFLLKHNIKLLAVSCHTACTTACEVLQNILPIPVIGVTHAGIDTLLEQIDSVEELSPGRGEFFRSGLDPALKGRDCVELPVRSVAILGTERTIGSGKIQKKLRERCPSIAIEAIACPLFVPLVEEGLHTHPAAEMIVEHYLAPLKRNPPDCVLLACTHYPLLTPLIRKFLGPEIKLIEPAHSCASQIRALLQRNQWLNRGDLPPKRQFFVSDDPEKFHALSKTFFSPEIENVELA